MDNPNLPIQYDAARKAIAACVAVDEAKEIKDKALALQVYAYQSRDGELAAGATALVRRAIRRIGEIIVELREAGRLQKGGQAGGKKSLDGIRKNPTNAPPSLADQGVDKRLAHEARKAAAMSEAAFEADTAERMETARIQALKGDRATISKIRAKKHVEVLAKRTQREAELAARIKALPDRRYGVILADPEWRFETRSVKGKTLTSAENHYPTSDLEVIKARPVGSIAADDSMLFLWATVPMLAQALEVLEAWGFQYVSSFVWVKDRTGTGYWIRNRHEVLLIGRRGRIMPPAPGRQPESVIEAPRGRHSEKPAIVYEIIERMFPNLPKIELNARRARDGWDRWGLEA